MVTMTLSEYAQWVNLPATRALLDHLQALSLTECQAWGNGMHTGTTQDETVQKNAKALGRVEGFQQARYSLTSGKGFKVGDMQSLIIIPDKEDKE